GSAVAAMRDIYLITMNEIRVTIRNPFWAFSGLFQPIIYLLLFGPLLNGVAGVRGFPGGGNAIQFFAPGLLIMNALFGSGFEGFTLRDKLDSGFLERLRVTPISRLALALGFILQSSVNLVIQSIALIACSFFFGLQLHILGAAALIPLVGNFHSRHARGRRIAGIHAGAGSRVVFAVDLAARFSYDATACGALRQH